MANKCLVTGANGHLGNNLVRILIEKGIFSGDFVLE